MHTEERFKQLLDRYLSGTGTPEEQRAMEVWFEQGGDTGKPDLQLSRAAQARILQQLHQRQGASVKIFPLRYRWLAAAVCIGLLVAIGFGWWRKTGEGTTLAFITIHTGKGEVRKVLLPDHSVVWINANSTLAYHPGFATHRQVRLSGEALFAVAPDGQHPFSVRTDDNLDTRVLGTVFNINSYQQQPATQITVLSGKIQVSHEGLMPATLTQRQGLRYDRIAGTLTSSAAPAMETMSWTTGEWDYDNMHVGDLALLLENQYNVIIRNHHADKDALQTGVSVNFSRHQQAADIVSTFCALAGCHYRKLGETEFEIY